MRKVNKAILLILIVLNLLVLLGQVWPEGAPPFATQANITFLIFSLLYFFIRLVRSQPQKEEEKQ